ncbi:MAG: hypothetical protein PVF29_12915, partial [Desulfobacterales bacterium]
MQNHLHHCQFVKIGIEQTAYHAVFLSQTKVVKLSPLFKITYRMTELRFATQIAQAFYYKIYLI